jgi:DNA-binding CsgD family transcriptional regulator
MKPSECHLCLYLLELVRCAVENNTARSKILAEILCLTPRTVDTYWKRIVDALQVKGRYQAMELVQRNGWLEMPASLSTRGGKK